MYIVSDIAGLVSLTVHNLRDAYETAKRMSHMLDLVVVVNTSNERRAYFQDGTLSLLVARNGQEYQR